MGLVSAKEMLEKAVAGHYAVGQFSLVFLKVQENICVDTRQL